MYQKTLHSASSSVFVHDPLGISVRKHKSAIVTNLSVFVAAGVCIRIPFDVLTKLS